MSWDQLQDIIATNKREQDRERREPPVACPIDGAILDIKNGVRNCPMGNYRWPR